MSEWNPEELARVQRNTGPKVIDVYWKRALNLFETQELWKPLKTDRKAILNSLLQDWAPQSNSFEQSYTDFVRSSDNSQSSIHSSVQFHFVAPSNLEELDSIQSFVLRLAEWTRIWTGLNVNTSHTPFISQDKLRFFIHPSSPDTLLTSHLLEALLRQSESDRFTKHVLIVWAPTNLHAGIVAENQCAVISVHAYKSMVNSLFQSLSNSVAFDTLLFLGTFIATMHFLAYSHNIAPCSTMRCLLNPCHTTRNSRRRAAAAVCNDPTKWQVRSEYALDPSVHEFAWNLGTSCKSSDVDTLRAGRLGWCPEFCPVCLRKFSYVTAHNTSWDLKSRISGMYTSLKRLAESSQAADERAFKNAGPDIALIYRAILEPSIHWLAEWFEVVTQAYGFLPSYEGGSHPSNFVSNPIDYRSTPGNSIYGDASHIQPPVTSHGTADDVPALTYGSHIHKPQHSAARNSSSGLHQGTIPFRNVSDASNQNAHNMASQTTLNDANSDMRTHHAPPVQTRANSDTSTYNGRQSQARPRYADNINAQRMYGMSTRPW